MSFDPSQITSPLQDAHSPGIVKIAGYEFPALGTDSQKVAALERAMVNIYRAIEGLAGEISRIEKRL